MQVEAINNREWSHLRKEDVVDDLMFVKESAQWENYGSLQGIHSRNSILGVLLALGEFVLGTYRIVDSSSDGMNIHNYEEQ